MVTDIGSMIDHLKFIFPIHLQSSLQSKVPRTRLSFQIFGCSGVMFALNSSLLLLYKMLEEQGKVVRVSVERVSLDKVPASLLSGTPISPPSR